VLPIAALSILALTALVSVAGLWVAPSIIERSVFRPYWFLPQRQYGTAISSAFVHADLGHLVFNGLTFWFFAPRLEQTIGSGHFLALYALGLIASDVGTYFKHRADSGYACLGASGAILAVLFASIVYFPQQRIFMLPLPIPIPAPLFAVCYLVYTFYAARHPRGHINNEAHFYGALAGLAFVALTDIGAWKLAMISVFR
jgi:membrane associated rhomboid family serine protease